MPRKSQLIFRALPLPRAALAALALTLFVSASPAQEAPARGKPDQAMPVQAKPSQTKPSQITSAHARHARRKPAAPPLVLPPLAGGPLPQMPMDTLPAAAPRVGFQGGLLTIVAQNSTLGDILRDVHKLTGAAIDVPPNANERVVTRLGPGAPRDVLASLLNGSSFNYVMLGSDTDPAAVTSLVLTAKTGNQAPGSAGASQPGQAFVSGAAPQPFVPQPVVPQAANVQPAAGEDESAATDDQEANADENAENADQDQSQTGAVVAGQPDQQQQQQPPQPGQPNAGPKTPEQILEMLRRQQPASPNPQQPPEQ